MRGIPPGGEAVRPRGDRKEVRLQSRCVSLWIGPALGALERACLRSVLRQGHELTLYCYAEPAGVPEGVALADAARIVPADRVIRYPNGSYSLFANRFRYELQKRGLGTWLDCDVYLLRPLDMESRWLVGEEASGVLGTGVLRLPPDSPVIAPLLVLFADRTIPPWLGWRAVPAAWWRRLRTGRAGIEQMPWATTGPRALTALARSLAPGMPVVPPHVLYPVSWRDAEWLLDPAQRLEDRILPATVSIHLWNERIKHVKDRPARPGSFLARLQQEGR